MKGCVILLEVLRGLSVDLTSKYENNDLCKFKGRSGRCLSQSGHDETKAKPPPTLLRV